MALETALIIIGTFVIILLIGVPIFLSTYFYKKFKRGVRAERLAKSRAQRRIEKSFEREFHKNIVPQITENPTILDAFPNTLDLAETYNEEPFFFGKLFNTIILPFAQGIGQLTPSTPTEQKIVGTAQAVQNPIAQLVANFIGNALSNPKAPQPSKPKGKDGKPPAHTQI